MLRSYIILLLAIFISQIKLDAQAWAQLPDFPGPERDDGVAFVINSKAYCGTGLKVGWSPGNDFYCLDLGSETWTTAASMPAGQERQYACGFTDGTNGYVFGGEAYGSDLNSLWMYSPATNSWTAKASKPGNGVRGASCFVIGTTAYIIGGAAGTADAINEVWAYDMTSNSWTQKNNLPFTNWRGCASDLNNKGYLFGGKSIGQQYNRYLYEYNPVTDNWTYKSTFAGAFGITYASMQTVNDQLVIFSGIDSLGNCTNDLWTFNTGASQWQFISSLMTFQRKGGMGFSNNGTYYYTCGITPSPTDTRLKETWKTSYAIGVNETERKEKLKLYPNPVKDILYLDLKIQEALNYCLTDISGRIIKEGITENRSIDLSALVPGLYFLRLESFSFKIIKQ